jgi:hypothetical protein
LDRTARPVVWAALAAVALCALVSSAAPAATRKAPRISIVLGAPGAGTLVARYGASPVFHWQIETPSGTTPWGSGRLEVSTTRTLAKEVVERFNCGYEPGDCPTQFQWKDVWPYWYDQSDPCSSIPAVGNCATPPPFLYWRVRFEPVGGRSYSSRVVTLRRPAPTDIQPPTANAIAGTSVYGATARFYFYATDNSGVTRNEIELYDGSQVVYGARTRWDTSDTTTERYMDVSLPTTVDPGAYRWCLTLFDYADNQATDCASYTVAAT